MSKKHFIAAASLVKSIVSGGWTDQPPIWADGRLVGLDIRDEPDYARAVHTAEAFIALFRMFNSRFDERRFLIACGLVS